MTKNKLTGTQRAVSSIRLLDKVDQVIALRDGTILEADVTCVYMSANRTHGNIKANNKSYAVSHIKDTAWRQSKAIREQKGDESAYSNLKPKNVIRNRGGYSSNKYIARAAKSEQLQESINRLFAIQQYMDKLTG